MRRTILVSFVIALLLAAVGSVFAGDAAPLSTQELKKTIGSGNKSTIVFFQNPQGGPCRAQKEILVKLQNDRKHNFNIANVSTMQQEDQKAFYEYGVRSLPSLVLVDGKGKINRVFPPGIQDYETLSAALNGVK